MRLIPFIFLSSLFFVAVRLNGQSSQIDLKEYFEIVSYGSFESINTSNPDFSKFERDTNLCFSEKEHQLILSTGLTIDSSYICNKMLDYGFSFKDLSSESIIIYSYSSDKLASILNTFNNFTYIMSQFFGSPNESIVNDSGGKNMVSIGHTWNCSNGNGEFGITIDVSEKEPFYCIHHFPNVEIEKIDSNTEPEYEVIFELEKE